MIDQSNIERVVMRRVRLIRLLALILSTAMLAGLTSVAALWGIGREVWVAHVLQNMPPTGDISALARFWSAAFLNTNVIVQALTLLTLGSLLFLIREIARLLSDFFTPTSRV